MLKRTETQENGAFDLDKYKTKPETPKSPPANQTGMNLALFTLTELMQLREDINGRLPPRKLAEVDLEEELVLQFQQAKALFNSVISDEKVPTNQRAQVANTCTALLEQLTKLQDRLYNSERVKAIESALVRAIKDLPEPQQLLFFTTYERLYAESRGAQ